jgi:hypothetical protein
VDVTSPSYNDLSIAAYVDNNLLGTGKIAKAAILGAGGGVWAASAGYTVCSASISLEISDRLSIHLFISQQTVFNQIIKVII